MIKAIIFDCFDVVLSDGFEIAYAKFGGDVEADRPIFNKIMDDSSNGKIESFSSAVAKQLGITPHEWDSASTAGYVINFKLLEYVLELKKSYYLAMLSNVGKGGLRQFFEPGFLENYFDPIVESGAIGYAKPEAAAYEYVADKLGVRLDECVMIDDRPDYIEGAQAVGLQGIVYENVPLLKKRLSEILERDTKKG